jgi:hypothetical protein
MESAAALPALELPGLLSLLTGAFVASLRIGAFLIASPPPRGARLARAPPGGAASCRCPSGSWRR